MKLTKAMQKTSETLQSVADLYDDHVCQSSKVTLAKRIDACFFQARRTLLATHESLKGVAHPSSLYEVTQISTSRFASMFNVLPQSVLDTHRSTLSRYKEATKDGCVCH